MENLVLAVLLLASVVGIGFAFLHGKIGGVENTLMNLLHITVSKPEVPPQPLIPHKTPVISSISCAPSQTAGIVLGGGVGYLVGDKILNLDIHPAITAQLESLGLPQWTATQSDIDDFKALPANQQAFLKFHAKTWSDTGAYTLGSAISTTQQIYAANPPGTPGLI